MIGLNIFERTMLSNSLVILETELLTFDVVIEKFKKRFENIEMDEVANSNVMLIVETLDFKKRFISEQIETLRRLLLE